MAALNRSQLRGVGSYLSSRGVGQLKNNLLTRRNVAFKDVELFQIYPNDFSDISRLYIDEFSSPFLQLFVEHSRVSLSLNLIQIRLLKLVLFVILIS